MTYARTNREKIRFRKEQQQQSKRIREQDVNNMHIFKQQMDYKYGLHNHDSDCGIYEEFCNSDK